MHYTPAFKKSWDLVVDATKQDKGKVTEGVKKLFRDEMLKLGHLERVRNLYRVKHKLSAKSVFFQPNAPQLQFLENAAGRDLILKCRQVGFTTQSCVTNYDLALWEQNMSTGIMAHKQNVVGTIFNDLVKFTDKCFKKDWGEFYSPTRKSDSSTSLSFSDDGLGRELNSSMSVLFDFRGKTIRSLHVSEGAFIEQDRLTGSLNAVPETGRVIIESTANGMGGEFYRLWDLQKKDPVIAPYKGFFIPWWQHYPEDPSRWPTDFPKDLTSYEAEILIQGLGLSPAHVYWRRWCIQANCQGDAEVFEQEYPTNDLDCFLGGADKVFSASVLKLQTKFIKPAIQVGWPVYA